MYEINFGFAANDKRIRDALHNKYHVTALLVMFLRKYAGLSADPATLTVLFCLSINPPF